MKDFHVICIRNRIPIPSAFAWHFGIPNLDDFRDYWIGRPKESGGYEFFVALGATDIGWPFELKQGDLIVVGKKKDSAFRKKYEVIDLDEKHLLLKPYEKKEGA